MDSQAPGLICFLLVVRKGKIGFKRQLSVDEIADQVLYFQSNGIRPDSISFMGTHDTWRLLTLFRPMSQTGTFMGESAP